MFKRVRKGYTLLLWMSMDIALVCLIVGIVGDAVNVVPGLEPTNWLIIAAGWLVAGCCFILQGLAAAIKE
jgi:hypothetical protein